MGTLNAERIPQALRTLIPVAEKWGIPDDVTRSARVKSASVHELALLVEAVDSVSDADLYGWLAAPSTTGCKNVTTGARLGGR